MKKLITYAALLLVVAYFSYRYPWFAFLLLALLGGMIIYMLLAGTIWMWRNNLSVKRFHSPFIMLGILLTGLVIGLLRPLPDPIISSGNSSKELAHAYSTDQGDRMNLQFFVRPFHKEMRRRDSLRLEQVREVMDKEPEFSPIDRFHAAFILHHNPMHDSSLYEQAHSLANKAASAPELKDNYQVQWLAKATYDRWMLSIGRPQKYSTQGGVSFSIE
ncbi:hypothetical protein DN752_04690 [Echinicola strongylocentroti]|uniref:Uncharacterized protein n=1 Tax=Echinicola strongylocentroti TaxID=1795355 RepID=A0A2Z4IFW2_9BACT|nr:hypothetical protein [Echinicola strongylocentroti]AWW29486.1 hypothetical protein DN752_04690 [Echinicola strongylocentroti]